MNNFFNKNKRIIIGVIALTLVIVGISGYSLHGRDTFNNLKLVAEKGCIEVANLTGNVSYKISELNMLITNKEN